MARPHTQSQTSRRKVRATERALVLLLCGCVLLLPPGAQIFQVDTRVFGIPAALAVLFLLWGLLIVGARSCARALTDTDADEDAEP